MLGKRDFHISELVQKLHNNSQKQLDPVTDKAIFSSWVVAIPLAFNICKPYQNDVPYFSKEMNMYKAYYYCILLLPKYPLYTHSMYVSTYSSSITIDHHRYITNIKVEKFMRLQRS